jgi:hypothetical protein
LLEEERRVVPGALITKAARPVRMHRASVTTTLAADDHPVDNGAMEFLIVLDRHVTFERAVVIFEAVAASHDVFEID